MCAPKVAPQQSRDERRPHPTLSKILNPSAKHFGGVTIEAPFPCLSFPQFSGLIVPNPVAQIDPESPRVDKGVENSAPSSRRCSSARDRHFQRGERSRIPPPQNSGLERRRAGGWKAGSWSPCPPSQHGKSRGTLCFQETAAIPAKKHEPEQSPAIFGLEIILPRSPKRHRGGFVTPGAPQFSHRAQPFPQKAPQIQGMRAGMTPFGSEAAAGLDEAQEGIPAARISAVQH